MKDQRRGSVAVLCGRLWGNAAVEHRARLEIASLEAAGYHVQAMTQQTVDDNAREHWPELVAGAPVIAEPGRFMGRHTSTKLVAFTLATARMMRGADAKGFTAVVSHSPSGVVGAYLSTRRHRVRLIYVCHESPRPRREQLPARHRIASRIVSAVLEGLATRLADLLVCPAPSSRDYYAAKRRRRPTIMVANPVDLRAFEPGSHEAKDIDVLYVGRLAAEKGPVVLLSAIARGRDPVRATIVGGGSERPTLEGLAARCPGPVTFTGVVANEDLAPFYRRARLVAVPSFTEAAGMVPVEAMACGTPVLASDVNGLADTVVEGVNGWFAPAGDVDAWAIMLADLLRDDDRLRMAGKHGIETAQRFDSRKFAEGVVAAYGLGAS